MVAVMGKGAYWLGVDRLGVERLGVDRWGFDRLGVDRTARLRESGRITDWRGIISSNLSLCGGENPAVVFSLEFDVELVHGARVLGRVWS
jgi:hypothetical protein